MSELSKTLRRVALEGRSWNLNEMLAVLDAHERLEAEVERLEGLLRARGAAEDSGLVAARGRVVYAEAVRLSKGKG